MTTDKDITKVYLKKYWTKLTATKICNKCSGVYFAEQAWGGGDTSS